MASGFTVLNHRTVFYAHSLDMLIALRVEVMTSCLKNESMTRFFMFDVSTFKDRSNLHACITQLNCEHFHIMHVATSTVLQNTRL